MAEKFELTSQQRFQDQGRDRSQDRSRERIGYGAPVGPTSYDSEGKPLPDIDIPENLSPKGLVEVVVNKENWISTLSKINLQPMKYKTEPERLRNPLLLNDGAQIDCVVYPMSANINSEGEVYKNPARIDIGLKNPSNDEHANIPKTVEGANRGAILKYFVVNQERLMGWKKVSQDVFGHIVRIGYTDSTGNQITIENTGDGLILKFRKITQESIPTVVEDMRRFIEIVADLTRQLLDSDNQVKSVWKFPDFEVVAQDLNRKRAQGRRDGSSGMVSGFDVENNRKEVSGYSLEDMGGNPEVKREIGRLIKLFDNLEHFRKFGVKPPKGVLLEGPPGTGKTLAARIVASSLGIPFYEFSSADLKNVWSGESPKIVRSVFRDTETPCVVFFDEFDVIGKKRDESSETQKEIIQELLKGMDGLESRTDIIVIAATNNAEQLDEAVRRVGRFDKKIHVGLPNQVARAEIFRIHHRRVLEDDRSGIPIFANEFNDVIFMQLADQTEGFNGAEIAEVFRRAVMDVAEKALDDPSRAPITHNDLPQIIEEIKREKADLEKVRREDQNKEPLGFRPPRTLLR